MKAFFLLLLSLNVFAVTTPHPNVARELDIIKNSKDRVERGAAIQALGEKKVQDPVAQETLIEVIKNDPDETLRKFATRALGNYPSNRTFIVLLHLISNPQSTLRADAAQAFAQLGDKRAVHSLIRLFANPESTNDERHFSMVALVNLVTEESFKVFLMAAESNVYSTSIRLMAIRGLGLLGDENALDTLKTIALSEPQNELVIAAIQAAKRINILTDQKCGTALKKTSEPVSEK